MGLWEELKGALTRTRNEAGKAAAKAAAKQAFEQAKKRVSDAGDGLLGALEDDLASAEKAREGRTGPAPYRGDMDDIEARIHQMAAEHDSGEGDDAQGQDVDPQAKAKAELARLKRDLLRKDQVSE